MFMIFGASGDVNNDTHHKPICLDSGSIKLLKLIQEESESILGKHYLGKTKSRESNL